MEREHRFLLKRVRRLHIQRTVRGVFLLCLAVAAVVVIPARRATEAETSSVGVSPEQAIALALEGEVGENDVRLSDMGSDALFDAENPAVAYNSRDDQYLVVWRGDDNSGEMVEGESEIFGQRVDGASGAEIGDDFRISDMGSDGDPAYDAFAPAVAYNSQAGHYLVVCRKEEV